jgi:uncharacterized protein
MKDKNKTTEYGLRVDTVDKINRVFAEDKRIREVILYGSRAKGNYRDGSDIDLAIVGDSISLSDLFKIENDLDDLLLPYKIDLCLLKSVTEKDLLSHIGRVGKIFYRRC